MIPTVLVKPRSTARCAICSASSGFFTPLPSTELIFTWNTAYCASHSSRVSSVFKLLRETSSGTALSMLICRCSSPAAFNFSMVFLSSKNPLVIIPAIMPRRRICRITSSISGCISGSPPLIVMIEVPMPARMSNRLFISSSGTGLEKSSNSLQYVQARLQRRLGIICTKIGCLVEASALPIMRNSRKRVRAKRKRLRSRTAAEGCANLLFPAIQNERCPSVNYTLACYTASTPVPAYYCWWRSRYLASKWRRNLMSRQPTVNSPAVTLQDSAANVEPRGAKSVMAVLSVAMVLIFVAAAIPAPIRAAWDDFSIRMQLAQSEAQSASPAKLSDHEIEEIANLPAQQQAERLLERAVNHYDGALELIGKSVDKWFGQLEIQGQLASLLTTALNSNDLHVRAAALEVELAGYNLPKRAESADNLIERIRREPSARPWALWMLGVLGNRGVETRRAFVTLMDHRNDPDEQTRYWTIEGLSLLGTDETVAPLLEAFRTDPSPLVRERGGCGLAQSGMLTREQRLRAVPQLLKMTDDMTLDDVTRGWVFQALRDITGATISAQPDAWRAWWAQHRS